MARAASGFQPITSKAVGHGGIYRSGRSATKHTVNRAPNAKIIVDGHSSATPSIAGGEYGMRVEKNRSIS